MKDELKKDILEYVSEREHGVEAKVLQQVFSNDPRVSSSMKTFEMARAELTKAGKLAKKKVKNRRKIWIKF